MASIDKISGDEVIEECLLSVLSESESLRNGKIAKRPSWLLREGIIVPITGLASGRQWRWREGVKI